MGYTATFLHNQSYSALDINKRLSLYVTSGVADPFEDGVPYNAGKLNDLSNPLVNAGVVPSTDLGCKVTINTTEKTVTILSGVCFFDSGTAIEIDASGVTLPYTAGQKNYVYVKSDLVANKVEPYCTTDEPTGDYVLLAEVSESETLTDKRIYARGKLPGYESYFNHSAKKTITETLPYGNTSKSYDFEGNIFENFAFVSWNVSGGKGVGIYSNGNYWTVWNSSYSQDDDGHFTDRILLDYIDRLYEVSLKVRIEDGVVWFDYTNRHSSGYTITFDVYAF